MYVTTAKCSGFFFLTVKLVACALQILHFKYSASGTSLYEHGKY